MRLFKKLNQTWRERGHHYLKKKLKIKIQKLRQFYFLFANSIQWCSKEENSDQKDGKYQSYPISAGKLRDSSIVLNKNMENNQSSGKFHGIIWNIFWLIQ